MVTAFILMNVERPRLRSIADDLLAIDGIAEVYSVAGPFDLVAIARVKEHEQLNDLVTEHVGALDGIVSTETLIAFRSFAKKDLGLLWDIGDDRQAPVKAPVMPAYLTMLGESAFGQTVMRPSRRFLTRRTWRAPAGE
jgi:hypothetical protein